MITSLLLKGMYKVGVNSNRKIKIQTSAGEEAKDVLVNVDKEVPFIRYRFENYGDAEIQYIKETKDRFSNSTHLVEIELNENTIAVLEKIKASAIENMAKYLYISIDNTIVEARDISENIKSILSSAMQYDIDRVMLKDNSTSLDSISSNQIIGKLVPAVSSFGKDSSYFGVCSSPLSFDEKACLTAVKARELMSKYCTATDMAIPSSNHQCMNNCGCIRYFVVDKDLDAPAESGTAPKKSSENSEKKVAKPKNNLRVGMYSL